jgi:hypothetical protein
MIKEDIVNDESFADMKGIETYEIEVDGNFSQKYKLLSFKNVVDCIDWNNSKRATIEFLSKLVLDRSKIPNDVDAFFLSNWDNFGGYRTIINEKLKDKLCSLKKASDFLIFDKIIYI